MGKKSSNFLARKIHTLRQTPDVVFFLALFLMIFSMVYLARSKSGLSDEEILSSQHKSKNGQTLVDHFPEQNVAPNIDLVSSNSFHDAEETFSSIEDNENADGEEYEANVANVDERSEPEVVSPDEGSPFSGQKSETRWVDTKVWLPLPAKVVPRNPNVAVNLRSLNCGYFCSLTKHVGYEVNSKGTISSLFNVNNQPELLLITHKRSTQFSSLKRTMINHVGRGSACIGAGKGMQLKCRKDLASKFGCDFDSLGVQPPQWNLKILDSCHAFEQFAQDHQDKIWIAKPGGSFHGKGITIHDNVADIWKKYGKCGEKRFNEGVIVQEFIKEPALMDGHKFDFRTYMLIASTDPFIVFYHDGFVRKAQELYSTSSEDLKDPLKQVTNDVHQDSNNHFFSFDQLQEYLSSQNGFPQGFMKTSFKAQAKRVTNYLFHSSLMRDKSFVPRPGRFQVFALDWMLDKHQGIHLLEANGNPLIADYPGTGLTPDLWTSMLELVKAIHVHPETLESQEFGASKGYKYRGWEMVYNELEVKSYGESYNACKVSQYAEEGHNLFGYGY